MPGGVSPYDRVYFYIPDHFSLQPFPFQTVVAPNTNPDSIEDIPDDEAVTNEMNNLNLKGNEMPADDDIPDMEEDDLEDAMNSNIIASKQPA
jgi:hypothetical protein